MAATDSGLDTTLWSSRARTRAELVGPGTTLADERLLPVVPALQPLLPARGLRRGTTVAVGRSAALALALVAGASAAGSWVAAVGLPDLGIVAAAESGIALERLTLVPTPGARSWATVVAALLDAVDVVLVRSPAGLPAGQARRLAARARERGAVLVPLGAWSEPADLRLAVVASDWHGLGQGHGRLQARRVEVVASGRGAATRERRLPLWLPAPDGTIAPATIAPATLTLAGEPAADPRASAAPVPLPGEPALHPRAPATPLTLAGEPALDPGASASRPPVGERSGWRPGVPAVVHRDAGAQAGAGSGEPGGPTLAGEGDAPAGADRSSEAPLADAG
jgi:hypothetical protein